MGKMGVHEIVDRLAGELTEECVSSLDEQLTYAGNIHSQSYSFELLLGILDWWCRPQQIATST
jgi:hypothetical protein